jgi:hypothetical protein
MYETTVQVLKEDGRAALSKSQISARVCLNQHHWLANRMRREGITFRDRSRSPGAGKIMHGHDRRDFPLP